MANAIQVIHPYKWFIYWKDGRLYFHRSWTGLCIFVASFVEEEGGNSRMVEARLNRNPEQSSATNYSRDAEMIFYLIDLLLLRRQAKFPSRFSDSENSSLENWSVVGRAMFGQGPAPGGKTAPGGIDLETRL